MTGGFTFGPGNNPPDRPSQPAPSGSPSRPSPPGFSGAQTRPAGPPTGFSGRPGPDPFADPFGGASGAAEVRPPVVLIGAAALCVVAALVVAALSLDGGAVYIGGWALAGPVAIWLLTAFARSDAKNQVVLTYSSPAWVPTAFRVAFVLAMVGVLANAVRIAQWAGRL